MLMLVGGAAATAALSSLYLRAFRLAAGPLTLSRGNLLPARGPLHVLARIFLAELIVVTGLCVIATGALAQAIGDVAGISDDAVVAWDIVKWPLLLLVAFGAFAALQRSAFSDPRLLESSAVGSSQVLAALAWAFAATGFALYLASFGTFEDTYGTIGSGIVLLVWLTLFSMLYYVTPDLRVAGIAALGAGAALSAVTWLVANAALAVCIANFDSLGDTGGTILTAAVFLGGAVGLQRRGAAGRAPERHVDRASRRRGGLRDRAPPRPCRPTMDDLVHAVSRALQNDVAHEGVLSPLARMPRRLRACPTSSWTSATGASPTASRGPWRVRRTRKNPTSRSPRGRWPPRGRSSASTAARTAGRSGCGTRSAAQAASATSAIAGPIEGNGHGGFKLQR